MRQFFLIVILSLLFSCDDGDITFQDSNFDEIEMKSCDLVTINNFYLFKNESDKSLILKLGNHATNLFKNELTNNSFRSLTLTGDIKLFERVYNREISDNDICTVLPPTNLQVKREWQSESGTIEVRTTAIKSEPNANGETRLLSYRHNIIIRNLTINRDGQLQTFDRFEVGFYEQTAEPFPGFGVNNLISKCEGTNRYQLIGSKHIFELEVPENLFENIDTPTNTPRIAFIGENHKFSYRLFLSELPANVCNLGTFPIQENWLAQNSINNLTGIIEVTTTSAPDPITPTITIYTHEVVLKKITMKRIIPNDDVGFLLGDRVTLGIYRVAI